MASNEGSRLKVPESNIGFSDTTSAYTQTHPACAVGRLTLFYNCLEVRRTFK